MLVRHSPAIAFLLVVIAAAIFVAVGRWILLPIDRAARIRRAPAQFSIGDFLCLFLAIQMPLAAIHVLVRGEERNLFWMFTVATWCIGPVVWFICGQALSRAGVNGGWQRMVYLGLVLPIVYYGLIPFVAMPAVWIWATVVQDELVAFNMRQFIWLWACVGIMLGVCGVYTRRLVQQIDAVQSDLALRNASQS